MADETKQQWLDLLEEASTQLSRVSGAERWQGELQEVHQRLSNNRSLVAVFGAFSAGKSSLINALLADSLLVVSPNPTTAAVTHIAGIQELPGQAVPTLDRQSDPTSSKPGPSGQFIASVKAKTRTEVFADVQQAFETLHLTTLNLDEAMQKAGSLKPADFAPSARQAVSFLRSTAAGYPVMSSRLGTSWGVGSSDLATLTANEQFAGFINEVQIWHDADVLKQGISLVDTPGVDSIHRRHTDVAFRYMRRADAIIFVLYYTHAFSRADKDFLLQLAGVQDVAGADKLMVVINAVDLAKSGEEREAVRNRVETELRQLGIRNPRVFEVSSQIAFASEQVLQGNPDPRLAGLLRQRLHRPAQDELADLTEVLAHSGVPDFRSALVHRVAESAESLAIQAAKRSLREVSKRIHNHWQVQRDRQQKDSAALAALQQSREQWLTRQSNWLREISSGEEAASESLRREWKELIFHAGERIRLRFGNLIREAFHPGRFRTGSGRQALAEAGGDLLTMLSRQVELECRTFALRAVQQLDRSIRAFTNEVSGNLLTIGVLLDYSANSIADPMGLEEASYRAQLDEKMLVSAYRHFSNPKQFFEQNGQHELQLELESSLLPAVRQELERLAGDIVAQGIAHLQTLQVDVLQHAAEGVRQAAVDSTGQLSEKQVSLWADVVDWFQRLPLQDE